MYADYPHGPKEPGKIERTLDIAAKIIDDPFPDPDDDLVREPTPREIGRAWVEHWRAFAQEHGFAYRGGVSAPGFAPDEHDAALLADMRELRLPLHETAGICRGTWQGVPFTSFDAINFGAAGTHWPYRFVCARVREHGPDVVYDRALRKRRPYHVEWYPRLPEYRTYSGPWADERKPGKLSDALSRNAFGRKLSKAVEGAADRLLMPKLHTTSLDLAGAIGAQPYDQRAFFRDWALRGRWLVVFGPVSNRFDDPAGAVASHLDGFVAVHRLWKAAHDGGQ